MESPVEEPPLPMDPAAAEFHSGLVTPNRNRRRNPVMENAMSDDTDNRPAEQSLADLLELTRNAVMESPEIRSNPGPLAKGLMNKITEMAPGKMFMSERAGLEAATRALSPYIDEAEAEAAIRDVLVSPLPTESWDPVNPPAREWLIPDLLPQGRLAALYGTGGAGKSLLALQLAAAVMHGGSPLKPDPAIAAPPGWIEDHKALKPLSARGKVLWLTWEDEKHEIIRRWQLARQAGAIGEDFPDPDKLSLVDMRKIGGPLWGPAAGGHVSSRGSWTEAGKRFLAMLAGHKLAVLDPLAAAYASSEIDRALVREFTSRIDGAAEASGCTVLMIGHPPKTADSGGYSGSTDWQASVRAFFELKSDEDGSDIFSLINSKQSYAATNRTLYLKRYYQPGKLAWFGTRPPEKKDKSKKDTSVDHIK